MDISSDKTNKVEDSQGELNLVHIASDQNGKLDQSVNKNQTKPKFIGDAWLEKDGTITMHLLSDADGNHANATFSYKASDRDYKKILEHLGGLKAGEKKPVKPFQGSD